MMLNQVPRAREPPSGLSRAHYAAAGSTTSSSSAHRSVQQQQQRERRGTTAPPPPPSSASSSTTSTATSRIAMRQQHHLQHHSNHREADIGPEKFASKVFVHSHTTGSGHLSPSSSSSGRDSDTDDKATNSTVSRGVHSSSSKRSTRSRAVTAATTPTAAPVAVCTSGGLVKEPSPSGSSTTKIVRISRRHSSRERSHDPHRSSTRNHRPPSGRDPFGPEMSGRHHESSSAQQAVDAPPHAGSASDHANTTEARAVRRDSRARRKNTLEDGSSSADNATVAASLTSLTRTKSKDAGEAKSRPIRIRYETPTRGLGGGKREISHASLGKLVARLTDAHQYDTEFRDVFLLTYRGFCTPYDFIKKLMKRYTAVLTLCSGLDAETLKETQILLDQIAREEEDERGSMISAISTAKSDINTGMEASVSIMRLLSVLKYWIKESTFIDMDLQNDRRAQKKLMGFLAEIQSSSPIGSIRKHAENMLLVVAQLIRQQQIQLHQQQQLMASQVALPPAPVTTSMAVPVPTMQASYAPTPTGIPPPPKLTTSASVSSISDSATGTRARMMPSTDISQGRLTAAMSKLKLSRSSSDPKRERSMVKLKTKQSSGDIFQLRTRSTEEVSPNQSQSRHSPTIMATTVPKMMRGVTTGSAEMEALRPAAGPNSPGLEDVIQDTLQRARMTAAGRSSSRTSYDNVEPLSGISAQEMADQLTLMEAENYFAKLNPRELTNKAWTRETKHKDAPNVMALIELFDSTAEWVSSEILHPQLQAVERAKIITLFIDTADNCQQMNNFNTMFEIATGLSAPCIRQLSTTWGLVGANALEKYQCLQQICSPEDNYRNYRQAYALAEGQPRLACWFILVKDLFTFEEAMKSIEDGLVNWQKFRKIYRVINEALDRQNFTYLPVDGSSSTGISRKGKGILRHDRRVTMLLRHRVDTIRKDTSVLYQLARNANTQESILFVNSLSEAGFL